jgi:bifunctional UDP-N-acetylglucosamine pyrophosphorylase/glucosamine-1-phosphate N-acetyltransferase
VGYLLKTILECDPGGVSVVVGREDDALCEYLKSFPSVTPLKPESPEYHEWRKRFARVFVLRCDLPFLGVETLRSFIHSHIDSEAGMETVECVFDANEAPPIQTQKDLSEASIRMRDAIVLKWMEKGVQVIDPRAVWIGPDVELGPGASLMPGAQIWGNSIVGERSVVGPYCILRNARLGRGVNLIANVIVEDSELGDYVKAGPFAYIREGSVLNERSFVGKFVEIKKTSVGSGSKVPHLSYMGDAIVGENVNIGAGSITCNYDGANKSQTRIGDRCFVGSDTMMVAPVSLGDDSMTGAGSTITADVPAGALAVGRARQRNLEGWALKKKQMEKQ